jgi:ribosomal protein L11 methyltransferase
LACFSVQRPYPRTIVNDEQHAFGTARHPNTVLCLRAAEEMALSQRGIADQEVLDFGCGTGFLAIAVVKWGQKKL